MDALITTILPTFQRADRIPAAIQTIQNQDETRLQIAVFDNASTDNTREVVECLARYDTRIKYHRRDCNVGPVLNYVLAMSSVATPYFSLFADDDELKPFFYSSALGHLQRFPEAGCCAGLTEVRSKTNLNIRPKRWRQGLWPSCDAVKLLSEEHLTWTSILFDRSVIDSVGLIDPLSGFMAEQNYEFRVALAHPIYFAEEVYATWNEYNYAHRHEALSYLSGGLHTLNLVSKLKVQDPRSADIIQWAAQNSVDSVLQLMTMTPDRGRDIKKVCAELLQWSRNSELSLSQKLMFWKSFVRVLWIQGNLRKVVI